MNQIDKKFLHVFFGDLVKINCPKIAQISGYAGLIPFLGCIIFIYFDLNFYYDPTLILVYYSAVILSFVGAISWGFITKESVERGQKFSIFFAYSTVPSLLAFFSLLLSPKNSLLLIIFGFILAISFEIYGREILRFPDWYLFLRIRLTTIVIICCFVGLFLI